ncbi:hypothetical protein FNV43_RR25085 [Rhamnella rubrinervis]|uniref:Uncharacterized protein n=1 Tax=Rhamnella rubrinervis TaxID=2594499 RepID=A0A8K0DMQ4_9ROSA|nr:hypothetical protein FNV43_RR25085 [Rhamnella rubrinervis]
MAEHLYLQLRRIINESWLVDEATDRLLKWSSLETLLVFGTILKARLDGDLSSCIDIVFFLEEISISVNVVLIELCDNFAVCCSMEEFLSGGDLYFYEYGVKSALFLIKRGVPVPVPSATHPKMYWTMPVTCGYRLIEGRDVIEKFTRLENVDSRRAICLHGILSVIISLYSVIGPGLQLVDIFYGSDSLLFMLFYFLSWKESETKGICRMDRNEIFQAIAVRFYNSNNAHNLVPSSREYNS